MSLVFGHCERSPNTSTINQTHWSQAPQQPMGNQISVSPSAFVWPQALRQPDLVQKKHHNLTQATWQPSHTLPRRFWTRQTPIPVGIHTHQRIHIQISSQLQPTPRTIWPQASQQPKCSYSLTAFIASHSQQFVPPPTPQQQHQHTMHRITSQSTTCNAFCVSVNELSIGHKATFSNNTHTSATTAPPPQPKPSTATLWSQALGQPELTFSTLNWMHSSSQPAQPLHLLHWTQAILQPVLKYTFGTSSNTSQTPPPNVHPHHAAIQSPLQPLPLISIPYLTPHNAKTATYTIFSLYTPGNTTQSYHSLLLLASPLTPSHTYSHNTFIKKQTPRHLHRHHPPCGTKQHNNTNRTPRSSHSIFINSTVATLTALTTLHTSSPTSITLSLLPLQSQPLSAQQSPHSTLPRTTIILIIITHIATHNKATTPSASQTFLILPSTTLQHSPQSHFTQQSTSPIPTTLSCSLHHLHLRLLAAHKPPHSTTLLCHISHSTS